MTRPYRLGGILAAIILIGFGVGAITIGSNGRDEVNAAVKQEQIVGSTT